MSTPWILAYDISRDRARDRVAARLLAHGVRVQRSVYEVVVPDIAPLMAELTSLVRVDRDVVQAFRQCRTCASQRATIGPCGPTMQQRWWVA